MLTYSVITYDLRKTSSRMWTRKKWLTVNQIKYLNWCSILYFISRKPSNYKKNYVDTFLSKCDRIIIIYDSVNRNVYGYVFVSFCFWFGECTVIGARFTKVWILVRILDDANNYLHIDNWKLRIFGVDVMGSRPKQTQWKFER